MTLRLLSAYTWTNVSFALHDDHKYSSSFMAADVVIKRHSRLMWPPLPLLIDNSSAFPACIITSKCPTLIHWLCSRDKIRMFVLSVVRPRAIVTWLRCLCMTDLLLCNSACAPPHPGHCLLKWYFLVSSSFLLLDNQALIDRKIETRVTTVDVPVMCKSCGCCVSCMQ